MKSIFTINHCCKRKSEVLELYNSDYKPYGWLYNESDEEIFIAVNINHILNEGDRVYLPNCMMSIVDWKCYYPIIDTIKYNLRDE